MKAVIFAVVAVTAAVCAPQGIGLGYQQPINQYQQPINQYADVPAQYSYQWEVNDDYSGNYYGHQEQRNGDNTQGSYYVRLPDTRLMRVEYYVDAYGYHPTITYEGEAQYPQPQQYIQQQPQFSQPQAQYSQPQQQQFFVQ